MMERLFGKGGVEEERRSGFLETLCTGMSSVLVDCSANYYHLYTGPEIRVLQNSELSRIELLVRSTLGL
jgi:hypothetical protein